MNKADAQRYLREATLRDLKWVRDISLRSSLQAFLVGDLEVASVFAGVLRMVSDEIGSREKATR